MPKPSPFAKGKGQSSSFSSRIEPHARSGPANTKRSAPGGSRFADPEDGLLETDSEEDEFESYGQGSGNGRRSRVDEESDEEDEDEDEEEEEGGEEGQGFEEDEEEGEGVGRWQPDNWGMEDDDDDDEEDEDDDEEEDDEDDEAADLRSLQQGLKSLPLSALAKAQRVLASQGAGSSNNDAEIKERRLADMQSRLAEMQRAKGKGQVEYDDDDDEEEERAPRRSRDGEEKEKERVKRDNKHAPTMMSTKRQVSRMRQVVDVKKPERRDPRFSSLAAGQIDADLHSKSYSFLPSMLETELSSLRSSLSVAQKAERTCRLTEKPRYTAERERIELELSRVRTRLERSRREEREREVLAKAKKEEKEKRDQGKGEWFMKKSEKRDLLLKARFDALEATGGKKAVKKAMDKKRKKIAGKEKKSRPFAPGGGGGSGGEGFKRRRV